MDGSTPATPAGSAAAPQNPPANPGPDPEQRLLSEVFGGKYKTVDEAKAGFWNLTNYASQAYKALEERANPTPVTPRESAFERLQREALLDPTALREAIREEATQLVNKTLGPLTQAAQARNVLAVQAPDYLANELAITAWLQKNPQAAQEVQRLEQAGLYDLAGKHALTLWQTSNPPKSEGNKEAKAQAALPNAQVPGQRAPVDGSAPDHAQVMADAIRYGNATGDRRWAYANLYPEFKIQIPAHLQAELQRNQ